MDFKNPFHKFLKFNRANLSSTVFLNEKMCCFQNGARALPVFLRHRYTPTLPGKWAHSTV